MHCVESVQIRSYFWSVFSRIRGEYGPEITPNLDTFHAVMVLPQKILAKECGSCTLLTHFLLVLSFYFDALMMVCLHYNR